MLRAGAVSVAMLLTAAGAGCIPVPYSLEPGFRGSRSNLGDGVPRFIDAGKTTKDEVLRELGRPDVSAVDESWFWYESDYVEHSSGLILITGGTGWALPVGAVGSEARLHRRLLVRFAGGYVLASEFKSQRCASESAREHPCEILMRDAELREERRSAILQATSAAPGERFERALWKDGHGLPSMWANLRDDPLNCSWARRPLGTILASVGSITFVPGEHMPSGAAPPAQHIARAGIAKLEPFGPSLVNVYQTAGLQVTRKDGGVVSFTVCDSHGRPSMDEINRIQSVLATPPPPP